MAALISPTSPLYLSLALILALLLQIGSFAFQDACEVGFKGGLAVLQQRGVSYVVWRVGMGRCPTALDRSRSFSGPGPPDCEVHVCSQFSASLFVGMRRLEEAGVWCFPSSMHLRL